MNDICPNVSDIDEYLFKGPKEDLYFEAKSANNELPDDFWETYSAFANTFGGKIALGLSEDKEHNLFVTGVKNPERIVKILWDNLNNPIVVNYNLLRNEDVIIEEISGKKVIVVNVPPADRRKRPIYIKNNVNSGTFKRNHEGDYHCRVDEIKEMIRDSEDNPCDSRPIESMEIDCFDDDTIGRYLAEVSALRPGHPWTRIAREEFLLLSGSAVKVCGSLHPTAAGLLMFGKVSCIRRIFGNYFLDYREEDAERRWKQRIHSNSGDWSGNIYDFVTKVMDLLSVKIGSYFELDGYRNKNGSETFISTREAVMNALIHADYELSGGVIITVSANTLSISNPGSMRIGIKEAMAGGHSDPRNATLMSLAMAVGWVERIGSGIFMIEKAETDGHLSFFHIEEDIEPSSVSVSLGIHPRDNRMSQMEKNVMDIIRNEPKVTMEKMATMLGVSKSSVYITLTKMKKEGRLVRIGGKKNGRWSLVE